MQVPPDRRPARPEPPTKGLADQIRRDRDAGVVPQTPINAEAGWTRSGWHGRVYGWKPHLVATVTRVLISLAAELTPVKNQGLTAEVGDVLALVQHPISGRELAHDLLRRVLLPRSHVDVEPSSRQRGPHDSHTT